MDEYISKHEAYTMLKDLEATYIYPPVKEAYRTAARRIDQMLSADVQPVKLGKWECEHYDELIECYVANCSECGYESTDNYRITPNHRYCEYCGTRMIKDGVFE